jgi:hypothetical protein
MNTLNQQEKEALRAIIPVPKPKSQQDQCLNRIIAVHISDIMIPLVLRFILCYHDIIYNEQNKSSRK